MDEILDITWRSAVMLENIEEGNLLFSVSDENGKLLRIKKYATELVEFTNEMDFEAYQMNTKTNYACAFALLQIGTLANRLQSEIQQKLGIPWRAVSTARNASINGHTESHQRIIFSEIEKNIPALLGKLEEILAD